MKTKSFLPILCSLLLLAACQQKEFRTVYPNETPVVSGSMVQSEVLYGTDSLDINVSVSAQKTPLSTLTIMVTCGEQENTKKIVEEKVRTKGYAYEGSFRYFMPFASGMGEAAPIKVYLTAENVEGDKGQTILTGCTGHRPTVNTLYIMPPTIAYTAIGKGKQMTKEGDVFTAIDLGYPKHFEFLLATVGTKFGRIDWTQPVFGLINGDISLVSQEQFESGVATSITIEDDECESIDTVTFNPITFELTYGGKIAAPVSKIDIEADLEEAPKYMSSSSVAKKYRGGKIFLAKDSEVEIVGAKNVADAYNLDYMEYVDGNKVKFLGETAMYYVSYNIADDYLVVEPLYELEAPEVMYLCGVGMGQPSHNPAATSGWGFDSPEQNFVARTIAPKTYQFTVYMKNDAENADHPGWGAVNFKFFHQHGWGGEETSADYTMSGLNILASQEASNVGNWWSSSDPFFEGIYRITLNQNDMTVKFEKVR